MTPDFDRCLTAGLWIDQSLPELYRFFDIQGRCDVLDNRARLIIKTAVSVTVTVLMVLAAELLNEPEMIFPEVAALAVGSFICDKLAWNVTPIRMFVLMSIAAAAGLCISVYIPLPMAVKVILAFVLCLIVLSRSHTTMLPVISAAVLPVLTSVSSIIYPISVLVLTASIIGIRMILGKFGLVDKISFSKKMPKPEANIIRNIWLAAVFSVITLISVSTGLTFIIAPPLAVVFAESSFLDSSVHRSPLRFFLCTILCAFTGAAFRLITVELYHLPLTVGVLAAVSFSMALLLIFMKPFPPAAALAVLPFILPQAAVAPYPFEVAAGAAVFIFLNEAYKILWEKGFLIKVFDVSVEFLQSVRILARTEEPARVCAADSAGIQTEPRFASGSDLNGITEQRDIETNETDIMLSAEPEPPADEISDQLQPEAEEEQITDTDESEVIYPINHQPDSEQEEWDEDQDSSFDIVIPGLSLSPEQEEEPEIRFDPEEIPESDEEAEGPGVHFMLGSVNDGDSEEEEKPSGVIQNVLGRFLGRRQKQSVPERIIQEETEEIPEEKPAVTVSATGNVRRRL